MFSDLLRVVLVVQFTQSCLTRCNPMDCSMPGLSVPHHLLESAQVHVNCIGDAVQPSHPLTPSSPSVLDLSPHQGLFQWVVCAHQMTKNTGASASPSVLSVNIQWISLRIDRLDLAVQVTFRTLLQHHILKASILWHSALFMVQFSELYVTTRKAIVLTIWIFVSRVMSLLLNTLLLLDPHTSFSGGKWGGLVF